MRWDHLTNLKRRQLISIQENHLWYSKKSYDVANSTRHLKSTRIMSKIYLVTLNSWEGERTYFLYMLQISIYSLFMLTYPTFCSKKILKNNMMRSYISERWMNNPKSCMIYGIYSDGGIVRMGPIALVMRNLLMIKFYYACEMGS